MLQTASADTKKANARGNSQPTAAPAGMLAPPVPALGNQASLRLQRKCDCGGAPDCDCDMGDDKKKKEKDGPRTALHRKPSGGALPASTLLDPETQSFFEARLQRKELRPAVPSSSGPPIQIGPVSDPLEAEADRVADQVMRMPDPELSAGGAPPVLRRKCAACEEEDAHKLQKKSDGQLQAGGEAPPIVHEVLRSPGQPLDTASRSFFEPRFGRDFSDVRIHPDATAGESARAVNALAYTVNKDVIFAPGKYLPHSNEGKRLVAHELAHVVQQRGDNRPNTPLSMPPDVSGRQAQGEGEEAVEVPMLQIKSSTSRHAIARAEAPAPLNWTPSINLELKEGAAADPLVTTAQKLAIQTLDIAPVGVWPNLNWGKVSNGAANRILHPELMNQTLLGLCGPAAALNAEALQAPESYAQLVVKVFDIGKVGSHAVNDTLKSGTPPAGMDQSDWMLMSAIQDVNNTAFDYYGRGDADEKRFRQSHTPGQVEADMKATGCVATDTWWCLGSGEIDSANKASNLLRAHPADIEAVMFVNADILQAKKDAGIRANHFIRLTQPMEITEANVSFKAFTWGAINPYTFPIAQFKHLVSAFVVGTRNKAVAL